MAIHVSNKKDLDFGNYNESSIDFFSDANEKSVVNSITQDYEQL